MPVFWAYAYAAGNQDTLHQAVLPRSNLHPGQETGSSSPSRGIQSGVVPFPSPQKPAPTHLQLLLWLWHPVMPDTNAEVLVDSGASSNFIDLAFTRAHKVTNQHKDSL